MKLYKLGLVIGRFQPLHNGHVEMIRRALELCEKVVIYVGSAQAAGTKDNPFSYCVREGMIEKVFETDYITKRLLVRPLYDIGAGNNDIWGRYILGLFEEEFHQQPDLYLSGCELSRSSWFNSDIAPKMDELRISRNGIKTSGTQCRQLLKENKKEVFFEFVPKELLEKYDIYQKIVYNIKEENE